MMKGDDHHEGQLHYQFQTKIRSIIPRSTAFSLPVAISWSVGTRKFTSVGEGESGR